MYHPEDMRPEEVAEREREKDGVFWREDDRSNGYFRAHANLGAFGCATRRVIERGVVLGHRSGRRVCGRAMRSTALWSAGNAKLGPLPTRRSHATKVANKTRKAARHRRTVDTATETQPHVADRLTTAQQERPSDYGRLFVASCLRRTSLVVLQQTT